jgi:predicted nucleic acid-binding protein
VTNPNRSASNRHCSEWLEKLAERGDTIVIPEIVDYELRRELIRASKTAGIKALDELESLASYLPLTTRAMRRAAELWAIARRAGQPTASDRTIDADMILVAQVETSRFIDVVLATTNVGHLSRFVDARLWNEIS